MKALKYVLSVMKREENQAEWRKNCGRLQEAGICCLEKQAGLKDDDGYETVAQSEQDGRADMPEGMLVITDDEAAAEECARLGIACIAYCPWDLGEHYFPHVQMVWESPEAIEYEELERFFCRFHGLPVLIARTGRLLLRESLPGDFDALCRMEQEAGWSFDVTETREKYLSYLKYSYSFYGYGYWTAELAKTGEIIGWCGFAGWGTGSKAPEFIYMKIENPMIRPEPLNLELGYVVDTAHRRRGLALEMCRAVLAYAFETLNAGTVWVKIERKNVASLNLAQKLGFTEALCE